MENYKWRFKKQFLFFVKHKYAKCLTGHKLLAIWAFILVIWHLIRFYCNLGMRVWNSLAMDGSWDIHLLCLVEENDLLQLLYLPIKAFATTILKFSNNVITKFHVKNMTVYMCDIHEIKKHAQVKAMLDFTIESL